MLPGQQSPGQHPQQPYQGEGLPQPYQQQEFQPNFEDGDPQSSSAAQQEQGHFDSSPGQLNNAPGALAPAPSSHFISTESFEGNVNIGHMQPGMGSQPLEMTEGELETPIGSTFTTPRQWGDMYDGGLTACRNATATGILKLALRKELLKAKFNMMSCT